MSHAAEEPHFHIKWSGHDELDWERFDAREMAEERARELVRPGEGYTIREQREGCPVCSQHIPPPAGSQ